MLTAQRTYFFFIWGILLNGANLIAESRPDCFVVDNFDQGIQNSLQGYRNTYQAGLSRASSLRVSTIKRGEHGRSLEINAQKAADGFCGQWIHLFDIRATKPQYFDARNYSFLSFWVKGATGGENVEIKLADRSWIQREDAVSLGQSSDYLTKGITRQWQEVLIPLKKIPRLDLKSLGSLVINFPQTGTYKIFLDDVSFKIKSQLPTPLSRSISKPQRSTQTKPRSMWVWSTESILKKPESWQDFFKFCQQQKIKQLWLQLPYKWTSDQSITPKQICSIKLTDQLKNFLKTGHQAQLSIHALIGNPAYCVKSEHEKVLSIVEAIILFNRSQKKAARFDGIHFDNEPYLLVGWHEKKTRERILRDFLDLNVRCQTRIHQEPGLSFGLDIPFWWQEKDSTFGECLGTVTFQGIRQPASYHCLEQFDQVVIMNYRNQADGLDGMIAHGRDLLKHADQAAHAKLWMGIETMRFPDQQVWFVQGLPIAKFQKMVQQTTDQDFLAYQIKGHKLFLINDGKEIHLGVELPPADAVETRKSAQQVLLKLAKKFHEPSKMLERQQTSLTEVQTRLLKHPEWSYEQQRVISDSQTKKTYAGFLATMVVPEKITFANRSYEELQRQTEAADHFFNKSRFYSGISIHYYQSYREKVEELKIEMK